MKHKLFYNGTYFFAVFALLLLVGCGNGTSTDEGEIRGVTWHMITVQGAPILVDTDVTLEVTADGIAGLGGCNQYSSQTAVVENGKFSAGQVISTMMACEEGIMTQETAYLEALSQATTYRVADTTLEFLDAAGDVILIFTK